MELLPNVTVLQLLSNHTDQARSFPSLSPLNVVVSIFLTFFTMLTIFGNFLVIFAVLKERYLRSITNYFIVSLATADLFMGTLVMPFGVIQFLGEGYWPFGQYWCDLWHAFDVLSSTASILNLCMIALERYWATENPINYSTRMTKFRCLIMICLVWVCSSAISFPAIVWWRLSPQNYGDSSCEFTTDPLYLVSSSTVSFYGPLVVMLVVYYRIYRTATDLVRSLNEGSKVIYKNGGSHGEVMILKMHRGGLPDMSLSQHLHSCQQLPTSALMVDSDGGGTGGECSSLPPSINFASGHHSMSSPVKEQAGSMISEEEDSATKSLARKLRNFAVGKRLSKFAREQKAAKTLGIVMGIFIICWLPFFVCNIILAVDDRALSISALIAVTWLGYINSSINPMIYAHSMKDFRRAFIKLLCSCCCCLFQRRRSCSVEKSQIRAAAMAIASSVTVRPRGPPSGQQLGHHGGHHGYNTVLSVDPTLYQNCK